VLQDSSETIEQKKWRGGGVGNHSNTEHQLDNDVRATDDEANVKSACACAYVQCKYKPSVPCSDAWPWSWEDEEKQRRNRGYDRAITGRGYTPDRKE